MRGHLCVCSRVCVRVFLCSRDNIREEEEEEEEEDERGMHQSKAKE